MIYKPSLRIGIDFDNTIVCYENVLKSIISKKNDLKIKNIENLNKVSIRNKILKKKDGINNWKSIQAELYGKNISKAKIYEGFIEFLCICKINKVEVFIVSHKTKTAFLENKKVQLINSANKWLKSRDIIGNKFFSIDENHIYFEETIEKKIDKIKILNLDFFIDDLEKVIFHKMFPKKIKKILFKPGDTISKKIRSRTESNSWREISYKIFGTLKNSDIKKIISNIYHLKIREISTIKKGGNSRILKFKTYDKKILVVKIYPDLQIDNRERLNTEFLALSELRILKFPVVKPISKNRELNWAIYEFVPGIRIKNIDKNFINSSLSFAKSLKESIKIIDFPKNILSSQACLSGSEIENQIYNRYEKLIKISNPKLDVFLKKDFNPKFSSYIRRAKSIMNDEYYKNINYSEMTLSPADFGAHNAIRKGNSKIIFIDFEYFGWDDPVKMVSDYIWCPAMNIKKNLKQYWISECIKIFNKDALFLKRLDAYLPLYCLRWNLILLNEFLPSKVINRIHAEQVNKTNINKLQINQLHKSKNLLKNISTGLKITN